MKKGSINYLIILGVFSLFAIVAMQLIWLNKTVELQQNSVEIQNREDSLNLVQFSEKAHRALRDVLADVSKQRSDSSVLYESIRQKKTNYFVVDINEELHPFYLENLLKEKFYKQNLNQDFQYGIYDCFSDSIVYGNLIRYHNNVTNNEGADSINVQPSEGLRWKKDGHYFTVFFPSIVDQKVESKMNSFTPWMYIFLIVLLVFLFFGFSLSIILKQKKLSEIKNDFINNMTHELKTPIATIGLSSETLLKHDYSNDPDKIKRFAGIIHKENKRLENQVERVLNVAKLDKEKVILKKSTISIHELLEEVKDNFDFNQGEKGGVITLILDAQDDDIRADEVHISNVFYNLIDNAIKYTSETPDIQIRTKNENSFLRVEIEDKGIGMKREDLSQIFEKFFRVHTGNRHDVKGFGLGLFYVKLIINAHKAKIEVKSSLGKGTTFILLLPKVA
jgi:two-component system phosphate regulon sensor histidine kinase PhoR